MIVRLVFEESLSGVRLVKAEIDDQLARIGRADVVQHPGGRTMVEADLALEDIVPGTPPPDSGAE